MKTCPFCAEPIQDAAIKCRYCGSMLSGTVDQSSHEASLLRAGRKIEAIKALRERTGLGLKEAKDAIDQLEQQLGLGAAPMSATAKSLLFWTVLLITGALIWWFATPR